MFLYRIYDLFYPKYELETRNSALICSSNQWTGFYVIGTCHERGNLFLMRSLQRPRKCIKLYFQSGSIYEVFTFTTIGI